ncbi:hypothetical protein BD309DRAFT_869490 [Dichomitus squalens]|nr:hypothetical protein BD309DRAFT_869490 [Dichomitus squalens]
MLARITNIITPTKAPSALLVVAEFGATIDTLHIVPCASKSWRSLCTLKTERQRRASLTTSGGVPMGCGTTF